MDHLTNELALIAGGLIAGILAGLLGSGGGFLTVPLMLAFNYSPIQTIGTTGLAVSITAISGSIQNSRMGYFSLKRVLGIGIPALIATQISVHIANQIAPYILLTICGVLMLLMIYLVELRRQLIARAQQATVIDKALVGTEEPITYKTKAVAYADQAVAYAIEEPVTQTKTAFPHWLTSITVRRVFTGSLAGLFAGMVGGGAGSLLVPTQMLILGESIKVAIQTSIGVNIITSTSSWINHASRGNVLFVEGFMLAVGGFLGAQIGTRYLPKLPDRVVKVAFNTMIVLLALYILWKAWRNYQGF